MHDVIKYNVQVLNDLNFFFKCTCYYYIHDRYMSPAPKTRDNITAVPINKLSKKDNLKTSSIHVHKIVSKWMIGASLSTNLSNPLQRGNNLI